MPLFETPARLVLLAAYGLLAGVTHAVAEFCLLWALGAPLTPIDFALTAASASAAGAVVVAGLGLALLSSLRPKAVTAEALRRAAFIAASLAYTALAAETDYTRGGLSGVLGWTLPGLLIAVVLALWLQKQGPTPGSFGGALVMLSTSFCALGLAAEEIGRIQTDTQTDFAVALVAFALAGLAVGAAGAWVARGSVLVAPVVLLALLQAASFALGPDYYAWRARIRPPVLAEPASGPNLILIVLDTVRADHLDLFGYERETMPLLKKRAESEFDLVRAIHSTAPWTLPSHASMFTGRYPWSHSAHHRSALISKDPDDPPRSLAPEIPTLAETMAAAGYATAGIVANYGVLSGYGMDRGFASYHAEPATTFMSRDLLWIYRAFRDDLYKPGFLLHAKLPEGLARSTVAFNRFRPWQKRAYEIRDEASEWLDANQQRAFFLFLNFMDAHSLYLPVEQDDGYFVERPEGAGPESFRADAAAVARGAQTPRKDYIRYYEGQYDAEMRQLDRVLDSFFEELKARGLFDESLIIVTSDHGEEFMEHGHIEHGDALFETLIRVPFLLKLPASASTVEIEDSPTLQHVDLFPTVAHILGFEAPAGMQGRLWGRGRAYELAEVYRAEDGEKLHDLAAVIIGDQKLLVSTEDPMLAYDLEQDPQEMQALKPPPSELAKKGVAVTSKRVIRTAGELPGDADPEMVDRLKSLGYIQ